MRKNRSLNRKALAIGAALGIILATAGGVAIAYWTPNPGETTGEGQAETGTAPGATDLTYAQTTPITGLAPGDPAQAIDGTLTNNNAEGVTVHVNTVTFALTVVPAVGAPAGDRPCEPADYTLVQPAAYPAPGVDIAAGGSVAIPTGGSVVFANSATVNQDNCQGATVTLTPSIT